MTKETLQVGELEHCLGHCLGSLVERDLVIGACVLSSNITVLDATSF